MCPHYSIDYLLESYPRFWSKVQFDSIDKCWLWQACISKGYGHFVHNDKQQPAHRVAYMLLIGDTPDGLVADHLCRVRHCVNPWHLEFVTNKENVLRGTGLTAKSAKMTHCKKGHAFDEQNTYLYHGHRHCKTCALERQRVSRAKAKNR